VVDGWTYFGVNNLDDNGHGTHVAGTIGGLTYGVAKSVKIVPVKVLAADGFGSLSGVIAGINWAVADSRFLNSRKVLNLSLGAGYSLALNEAVQAAVVGAGIPVVVAAGNDNVDACTQSPAGVLSAITVGATESSDGKASYSNYGSCVDIWAPGSSIISLWNDGGIEILDGTSMAAPHVAGVAARILSSRTCTNRRLMYPGETAAACVSAVITARATPGKVWGNLVDSPNRLLFMDRTT
jgi:subtilisin family serine protease